MISRRPHSGPPLGDRFPLMDVTVHMVYHTHMYYIPLFDSTYSGHKSNQVATQQIVTQVPHWVAIGGDRLCRKGWDAIGGDRFCRKDEYWDPKETPNGSAKREGVYEWWKSLIEDSKGLG